MNSKLYIIGTPIGNRNDITLRAVETLKTLRFFFVEDSREFAKLLELYGIPPSEKVFESYASHNMKEATGRALARLEEGHDVGLVTDRGMPCISDPGSLLVENAWQRGVPVIPVPGPSSVVAALAASGFRADQFIFMGFYPQEQKAKDRWFEAVKKLEVAVCLFESPRRVRDTAKELAAAFPHGEIFFGREMTKVYETFQRAALVQWESLNWVEKGEYVLVFHPGKSQSETESAWHQEIVLRAASEKVWAKAMGERFGVSSKTIYNALQRYKAEEGAER